MTIPGGSRAVRRNPNILKKHPNAITQSSDDEKVAGFSWERSWARPAGEALGERHSNQSAPRSLPPRARSPAEVLWGGGEAARRLD